MSAQRPIDLEPVHRAIVRAALATVPGPLGEVRVYGSRALGTARPGSDLDLVIVPPVTSAQADRLRLALEDSALPFSADVACYEAIHSAELRTEIDRTSRRLFPARRNVRAES
jgi:predicted nucleotidyltransferase